MPMILRARAIVGDANLLTGRDMAPWLSDWTGKYSSTPLAVARPANTEQVSHLLKLANETSTPVVPMAGATGLTGGGQASDALIISVERMNKVREIRADARIAIVEAGVILSQLHDAAADLGLSFPMTFGARGSARIGGILANNAGGSNVLRYGNTRDLCLGLEAVMADGRVLNLMSELHKDNSGLSLRNLLIGSEGTLGIITAAVLKLYPAPKTQITVTAALASLPAALTVLNRLKDATGGAVEAFEYMPRTFIEGHLAVVAGAKEPFENAHDVNILIEVASSAGPKDEAHLGETVETVLANAMEEGLVLDAVFASSERQRSEMWARREAAAEIAFHRKGSIDTDVAVPLDSIAEFFENAAARIAAVDPGADHLSVAHLGDGNAHITIYPTKQGAAHAEALRDAVDGAAVALGGSFSAEHGIGRSKLAAMARYKDPTALAVMRSIKQALDPKGILNPGKVFPPEG